MAEYWYCILCRNCFLFQLCNLNENELNWLSKHLGHSLKTHCSYYRQHEKILETAKISKLMLMTDSGQISEHAGKTLAEIEFKSIGNVFCSHVMANIAECTSGNYAIMSVSCSLQICNNWKISCYKRLSWLYCCRINKSTYYNLVYII